MQLGPAWKVYLGRGINMQQDAAMTWNAKDAFSATVWFCERGQIAYGDNYSWYFALAESIWFKALIFFLVSYKHGGLQHDAAMTWMLMTLVCIVVLVSKSSNGLSSLLLVRLLSYCPFWEVSIWGAAFTCWRRTKM